MPKQQKTFLLGLSISFLLLVGFFAGGLADRLFVIKPLDYLSKRSQSNSERTPLAVSGGLGNNLLLDVSGVVAEASPAVVTIQIQKQQRVLEVGSLFNLQPTARVESVQRDIGTGFVMSRGLVVTNKHVVSDAQANYSVIDANDKLYSISNIYRDPVNDLAILQVDNLAATTLPLGNSDELRVGQGVIAIGTALGEFRHTVTTGVVSGLGRGVSAVDGFGGQFEALEGVIQTDAAINPGNSGGPLLNMNGEVIGVNVAVTAAAQNIGFAIPINVVKASVDVFERTGRFERPYLGISYRNISQESATLNQVPQGAYILFVEPGSPAAQQGIQAGDIITSFAGQVIDEKQNLAALINLRKIGETVPIEYWRAGENKRVELTLSSR